MENQLRWAAGITTGGGAVANGGLRGYFGVAGGIWGQVGIQINPLVGVYYQTHTMAGGVGWSNQYASQWFPAVFWANEFTAGDVFQFGFGPSVDVVCINGYTRAWPGADVRLGGVFGGRTAKRWVHFLAGLDMHTSFLVDGEVDVVVAALATFGAGWY